MNFTVTGDKTLGTYLSLDDKSGGIGDISDEEKQRMDFLSIIALGKKTTTYKFALARFLIDYCTEHSETHVEFSKIAEYFLKYYWPQICQLKIKHSSLDEKIPKIVTIIEGEFDKPYYSKSFNWIKLRYSKEIKNCIEEITKQCFGDVIKRFHNVQHGKTETKFFKWYTRGKDTLNLKKGIDIPPESMEFLRIHHAILIKAVILEWVRFLEQRNRGLPDIISKTEGLLAKRYNLTKFKKILRPHFCYCFYCKQRLDFDVNKKTQVEHVIPFDYVRDNDIWNLTLVCQSCNCKKLGRLPPETYVKKLIHRNYHYAEKIPELKESMNMLDTDIGNMLNRHYENAKSQGYKPLEDCFYIDS